MTNTNKSMIQAMANADQRSSLPWVVVSTGVGAAEQLVNMPKVQEVAQAGSGFTLCDPGLSSSGFVVCVPVSVPNPKVSSPAVAPIYGHDLPTMQQVGGGAQLVGGGDGMYYNGGLVAPPQAASANHLHQGQYASVGMEGMYNTRNVVAGCQGLSTTAQLSSPYYQFPMAPQPMTEPGSQAVAVHTGFGQWPNTPLYRAQPDFVHDVPTVPLPGIVLNQGVPTSCQFPHGFSVPANPSQFGPYPQPCVPYHAQMPIAASAQTAMPNQGIDLNSHFYSGTGAHVARTGSVPAFKSPAPVAASVQAMAPTQGFAFAHRFSTNFLVYIAQPENMPAISSIKFKTNWEMRYCQLLNYKKKHGNCNIPQRYEHDVGLGRWVKDQRTIKKKGSIREERKELLERIGFAWKIKDQGKNVNDEEE